MELNKILEELNQYKHENREELLQEYIQSRLTSSIQTYYNELDKTLNYLTNRSKVDDLRVINKLKKYEKDKEM